MYLLKGVDPKMEACGILARADFEEKRTSEILIWNNLL